jgi:hypothetical protein
MNCHVSDGCWDLGCILGYKKLGHWPGLRGNNKKCEPAEYFLMGRALGLSLSSPEAAKPEL